MSENYQQIQQTNVDRQSAISPVFLVEEERRLSIIPRVYHPLEEDFVETKTKERHQRILFIIEPIIIGLILFPIVVLFWQCGWNLIFILLKLVNGYSLDGSRQYVKMEESTTLADSRSLAVWQKSDRQSSTQLQKGPPTPHTKGKRLGCHSPFLIENHDPLILNSEGDYSSQSLVIPYVIVQVILLCFYLSQDFFSKFLKKQNSIIEMILLKCHIFLLASIYIVQWEMIWTIWDQYTPHEWYFELLLSFIFLMALIIFTGHLSDLICAPFLVSYDSIEYCLQFDCPLLTRQVSSICDVDKTNNEYSVLLYFLDETMENRFDKFCFVRDYYFEYNNHNMAGLLSFY